MRISPCLFILSILIFSLALSSQDHCVNAITLTLQTKICDASTTTINLSSAIPTTSPTNSCITSGTFPPDLWVHVTIPPGPNRSIMIRRRAGTNFAAYCEVRYFASCTPSSSCCTSGGTVIGCFSFEDFPNAVVLEHQPPGDYYFRIWDQMSSNIMTFVTSAHLLPDDINDWILCDVRSGEGTGFAANQLIIKPGPGFDPAIYDPLLPDFYPLDTCDCASPPLILYEASDFSTFLEGQIVVQADPDVEGSQLNYVIPEFRDPVVDRCRVAASCSAYPMYTPQSPSSRSRVAIIDTGINLDHEGFENCIWEHQESDDSDNCVLGDKHGYDFKNDIDLPMDSTGHGSWVAGAVASEYPDDIHLELMGIKFHSQGGGRLFDAICGMYYAVEEGAQTLVTSWGFKTNTLPVFLNEVLNYSNDMNTIICASAGNEAEDNDIGINKYPANAPHDHVVVVTGYDQAWDMLSSYANFGKTRVDIATKDNIVAPGSLQHGILLTDVDSIVGTSIAAPIVAKTISIIQAYYPTLTNDEIISCIYSTAQIRPSLHNLIATEGTLDHETAMACAKLAYEHKICNSQTIHVSGVLINDATYSSQLTITCDAYLESPVQILFQSNEEVNFLKHFGMDPGAQLNVLIDTCTNP